LHIQYKYFLAKSQVLIFSIAIVIISYLDPTSHTIHKHFPDFLMQNQEGTWTMIEIMGDYLIDDAVTAAKEKYALEMGFVNKMEYRLMEASLNGNGQILM
jgi:hypothetical protein